MNKIVSFSCIPLFKGVGLAHLFNAIFIIYYYNVIIAWCVYFFGASFATTLPWTDCPVDGAERCFGIQEFRDCGKEALWNSRVPGLWEEAGVYLIHTCITSGHPGLG